MILLHPLTFALAILTAYVLIALGILVTVNYLDPDDEDAVALFAWFWPLVVAGMAVFGLVIAIGRAVDSLSERAAALERWLRRATR